VRRAPACETRVTHFHSDGGSLLNTIGGFPRYLCSRSPRLSPLIAAPAPCGATQRWRASRSLQWLICAHSALVHTHRWRGDVPAPIAQVQFNSQHSNSRLTLWAPRTSISGTRLLLLPQLEQCQMDLLQPRAVLAWHVLSFSL